MEPEDSSTGFPLTISTMTPQTNSMRPFLIIEFCGLFWNTMSCSYVNCVVQVSASTTGKKRQIEESQEAAQHK